MRPLSQLKRGERGVICEARLAPADADQLRAMGLCLDARVRLCRQGAPCVVAVSGCAPAPRAEDSPAAGGDAPSTLDAEMTVAAECRIGLARPLAERIMVVVEA